MFSILGIWGEQTSQSQMKMYRVTIQIIFYNIVSQQTL